VAPPLELAHGPHDVKHEGAVARRCVDLIVQRDQGHLASADLVEDFDERAKRVREAVEPLNDEHVHGALLGRGQQPPKARLMLSSAGRVGVDVQELPPRRLRTPPDQRELTVPVGGRLRADVGGCPHGAARRWWADRNCFGGADLSGWSARRRLPMTGGCGMAKRLAPRRGAERLT
jgi:hypothetical protein